MVLLIPRTSSLCVWIGYHVCVCRNRLSVGYSPSVYRLVAGHMQGTALTRMRSNGNKSRLLFNRKQSSKQLETQDTCKISHVRSICDKRIPWHFRLQSLRGLSWRLPAVVMGKFVAGSAGWFRVDSVHLLCSVLKNDFPVSLAKFFSRLMITQCREKDIRCESQDGLRQQN